VSELELPLVFVFVFGVPVHTLNLVRIYTNFLNLVLSKVDLQLNSANLIPESDTAAGGAAGAVAGGAAAAAVSAAALSFWSSWGCSTGSHELRQLITLFL
jgi:hypothetical protein